MFAIVDIETTGAKYPEDRIIEIGLVIHDGTEVVHTWETLLHPRREVPPIITNITGITDEMVETAPYFEQIAEELFILTYDKILVGHAVHFDYSFLQKEFNEAGFSFKRPTLDTLKLARKYFPDLAGYGLSKLCNQLEIPLEHHHRAFADAFATAQVFEKIYPLMLMA